MHSQSRKDWSQFEPAAIPSKTHIPRFDAWLSALPTQPAARVLDVGCGTGVVAKQLVRRGHSVVGVDVNRAAIAQLTAELPESEFLVADVARPEGFAPPESFDAAVCQLVISIVGDAEDRAQLLRNIARALRPGGALFISFSGLSDDLNPAYAQLYARDAADTAEHGSYFSRTAEGRVLYRTHHFGSAELEAMLRQHGFTHLDIEAHIEASSRRPNQRARFYYVTCRRAAER